MRGSLFPLFPLFWWSMSSHLAKTWTTKICQNHERVPISPIAPKGEVPKPWFFPYFPYFGGLCLHLAKTWNQNRALTSPRENGSLFPLLPLRVKCQNHERVPISPISPILVAYVFPSCQDMDHQNRVNRGNRDPLMVLALHP